MKRLMLFAALLAWSAMASAVVYKWTDAQGKVQYGDRPPDGVHAQVVEGLGTHTSAPTARAASSSTSSVSTSTANAANDAATKQAVDQDVAATREKQCTDAQARYKSLIEGRRLFKTGPDGERQYLTADQIDSERINAKREIDTTCNSPT